MIKLLLIFTSYFIAVLLNCYTYENKVFSFQSPDWLTVFSGGLALYAIYCEYRNRNKDDNRAIYVTPLLDLILSIKDIKDNLDVIATVTIHKSFIEVKESINKLHEDTSALVYKIGNRLQETDKTFGFKNKNFLQTYVEEKIYPIYEHLSQNSRQDDNFKKLFQKDINNLKDNIDELVSHLTKAINKISDKL